MGDAVAEGGERDASGEGRLGEKASGGHARDGVELKAVGVVLSVETEVDATEIIELERAVGSQGEVLDFCGEFGGDGSRENFFSAIGLVFALVIEGFGFFRDDFADR